ncbi:MAG: Unknown protein, partial [uncultured Aureispira sp.]
MNGIKEILKDKRQPSFGVRHKTNYIKSEQFN